MDALRTLLLNYKIPGVRAAQIRHDCAQELSTLLKYTISPAKIQYKDSVLYVQVPPILKSAIMLKQQELLKRLSEKDITVTAIK